MRDDEWMWVLVRDADVAARARKRGSRVVSSETDARALCGDGICDSLASHSAMLGATEILCGHVCRTPGDSGLFCSITSRIGSDFQRALANALDRLCKLLPEAGLEQMEIPIGADGDVDRHEVLFPMAAALLSGAADELARGASTAAQTAEQPLQEVLAELAILLSDRATEQSPF